MEVRLIEHNDDEIYLDKIGEIFFRSNLVW